MLSGTSASTSIPRCKTTNTHSLRIFVSTLLLTVLVAALGSPSRAQERYLVSTEDGWLSWYDLATNTLVTSAKGGGVSSLGILPGPNNRLIFGLSGDYTAVVDSTIQRETVRVGDANASSGASTPDGKLVLVSGYDGFLRFIDTATFQVVRKVNLASVLGTGWTGSVVVAANKAYIFPYVGPLANVAVVNLTTYAVSSITLPDGYGFASELAAASPDGKTIVTMEEENADGLFHVLMINTATNTIVADYAQDPNIYSAYALTVTPNGSDPNKLFGYVALQGDLGDQIVALDLRPGSQTYGHVLLSTAVFPQLTPYNLAINSDGTRVIVVGSVYHPPAANTYVIDALKMITDPNDAIVAEVTAGTGADGEAVGTGFFSTTPPNTAPVVSSVSGDITNDAPHDIQITGGNFLPGALAKIGDMAQLPATFLGGSEVSVAVPANAPSGKALDIIVTNPETQAPPDQQNQSGLLAGQFNILLNPKFQPTTQFAALNGDTSIAVYDLARREMVDIPFIQSGSSPQSAVFNVDGREMYVDSFDHYAHVVVVPIDLSNNTLAAPIVINGSHQLSSPALAASVDPKAGKPVINAVWRASSDLHVSVIDSDRDSPTFNTIVRTFDAGINKSSVFPFGMVVTADGKFAYMWYRTSAPSAYFLGIMDLSTGAFTHVSAVSLGVNQPDPNNGIRLSLAPDGKSLLLSSFYGSRWRIEVVDISKPMAPKRVVELVPAPVPGHGLPAVTGYQVVGDKLYAFDPTGVIVVFNFNRSTGDFRQRGWYFYPIGDEYNSVIQFAPNFAFSADGAWLYVADGLNDLIAVLDPAKLVSGGDAVFTTIRAPYYPFELAVSPVPPPSRRATLAHHGNSNGSRLEAGVH